MCLDACPDRPKTRDPVHVWSHPSLPAPFSSGVPPRREEDEPFRGGPGSGTTGLSSRKTPVRSHATDFPSSTDLSPDHRHPGGVPRGRLAGREEWVPVPEYLLSPSPSFLSSPDTSRESIRTGEVRRRSWRVGGGLCPRPAGGPKI